MMYTSLLYTFISLQNVDQLLGVSFSKASHYTSVGLVHVAKFVFRRWLFSKGNWSVYMIFLHLCLLTGCFYGCFMYQIYIVLIKLWSAQCIVTSRHMRFINAFYNYYYYYSLAYFHCQRSFSTKNLGVWWPWCHTKKVYVFHR